MSDKSMHWRNKSVLSVTIISWMGTVERLVFLDFNIHLESPNTGNITSLQCNEYGYVADDNEDLENGETRTINISDQKWAGNTKKGTTAHKRLSLLLHYCIYYLSQLVPAWEPLYPGTELNVVASLATGAPPLLQRSGLVRV